ncbi:DUF7064 domain-containing protein [Rhodococcus sp. NPDC003383]
MIAAEDVQFHTPTDVQHDWAETNWFSVYHQEPNITAWVYTIARPGVGAMVCDIEAFDRIGDSPLDALYYDFQQHLPLPDKLQSYSLPNGLSLETSNEPRDYHIRYVGHDDTEFDWHVHGIMEPYDIQDPSMDPLATGDRAQSGFGMAYANHFDMTVHVTGTTKIRGRTFPVDCVTVMDHSWGPRNEQLLGSMGWLNAAFGQDYSINTIWSRDLNKNGWDGFTFAHGYALIDGQVRGLKSGRLRATRGRFQMPVSYELQVVDVDDREHVLVGTPVGQHPWTPYSNSYVPHSTVRWHAGDRVGFGLAQENCPLDRITSGPYVPRSGS